MVALAWGWGVHVLHPDAFWWLVPVAGALVLSVPVSVLASRAWHGDAAALGIVRNARGNDAAVGDPRSRSRASGAGRSGAASRSGFLRAVVDPLRNAVHLSLLRGPRKLAPKLREARRRLLERALAGGPEALSDREKRVVLSDASTLAELHLRCGASTNAKRRCAGGSLAR